MENYNVATLSGRNINCGGHLALRVFSLPFSKFFACQKKDKLYHAGHGFEWLNFRNVGIDLN